MCPTLALIPLFLPLLLMAQSDVDQRTDKGQKIGRWVEYDSAGRIKVARYYEPIEKEVTEEYAFAHGFHGEFDGDSTIFTEELVRKIEHRYDTSGERSFVILWEDSVGTRYLYGPGMEVRLFDNEREFHSIGKVGSVVRDSLVLKNRTDDPLAIGLRSQTGVLQSDETGSPLKAGEKRTYVLRTRIDPGKKVYRSVLGNDSIRIPLRVMTYGYHLSGSDVRNKSKVSLPDTFQYYRSGEENLMRIFDEAKTDTVRTIPLSTEKTSVNFEQISEEPYWICVGKASGGEFQCCKAVIGKE